MPSFSTLSGKQIDACAGVLDSVIESPHPATHLYDTRANSRQMGTASTYHPDEVHNALIVSMGNGGWKPKGQQINLWTDERRRIMEPVWPGRRET